MKSWKHHVLIFGKTDEINIGDDNLFPTEDGEYYRFDRKTDLKKWLRDNNIKSALHSLGSYAETYDGRVVLIFRGVHEELVTTVVEKLQLELK